MNILPLLKLVDHPSIHYLAGKSGNSEIGHRSPSCVLPYRQLLGQLPWIARCTRPYILFCSVQYLSQFANCACKVHWMALLRVLRYFKSTIDDNQAHTSNPRQDHHLQLAAIFASREDSDWANDHTDRKSFSGSCVFYNGSPRPQLPRLQASDRIHVKH
eukprot:7473940-Pyramimonas_sp.AAC.1